jgi:hypothetical protein
MDRQQVQYSNANPPRPAFNQIETSPVLADPEDVFQRYAQQMTQDGPIDPGVRHDQDRSIGMRQYVVQCGNHPPLQVGNVFSARRPEPHDGPAALSEGIGPAPAYMGKRQALPLAQADFPQCGRRYDVDGAIGRNDSCGLHATLQIACENVINLDLGQPFAPKPSLMAPMFIERQVGLANEVSSILGDLYVAMTQQKYLLCRG